MIFCAKHLVIGDGTTVIGDGAVYVDKEGLIGDVGAAADVKAAHPGEPVTDYGDATILPGLMDMHTHFGYYYSQPDLFNYDDYMLAYYALNEAHRALRRGITTIRDVSSPSGLLKQLRLAGEKGFVTVPRIIHTDTGMCMTGGHGHDDGIVEVDGVDEIRKEIRKQRRDGADWIKVLTSNREPVPEFTQEELDAAADECRRRGIKCAVHAGLQPAIQMCIDAGFTSIEHGTFLTLEQAKQMAEKGIYWTPTITAYTVLYEFCKKAIEEGVDPGNRIAVKAMRDMAFFEPAYNAYKDNFKKFYDTGVTVVAGTDMVLYGAPAYPLNRELALMVEYGITPLQAIQTATENPARMLELEHVVGTLRTGLEADLLAVKGNAAEDIHALDEVLGVFIRGEEVRV